MSGKFDVYVRVSEVGDREGPSFGSPIEQEAAARAWIEHEGVEAGEVVTELDVSGAAPVDERELGRLIQKVESGDSAGVIVRYVDRFGRSMIENALAHDRIVAAGGRLIATASGYDSANLNADTRMVFNIQSAIAQAQRERNNEMRLRGKQRFAERGGYLASRPPLGYVRNGNGSISPDPAVAPHIAEIFRRRARGETMRSLREHMHEQGIDVTISGLQHVLRNRAYVGEATIPTKVKGEVEVKRNAHAPIITEEEFEQARAAGGPFHPRNREREEVADLRGLVYCRNGHRMKVGGGHLGVVYYLCTAEDCDARAGIKVQALDRFAREVIEDAVAYRRPSVIAALQGDDRYRRALDAVEAARLELDTYRAEVKISEVGVDAWKRDVQARQAALELARNELAAIPPPKTRRHTVSLLETQPLRDVAPHLVDRVVVFPTGRGKRTPAEDRARVYFVGEWSAPVATSASSNGNRRNRELLAPDGDVYF